MIGIASILRMPSTLSEGFKEFKSWKLLYLGEISRMVTLIGQTL